MDKWNMLPGVVRTTNIREIHFSRTSWIFEFLHEYVYVKEFGEGVDRMYWEMSEAGLPEPEYRIVECMAFMTLKNRRAAHERDSSLIIFCGKLVIPVHLSGTMKNLLDKEV